MAMRRVYVLLIISLVANGIVKASSYGEQLVSYGNSENVVIASQDSIVPSGGFLNMRIDYEATTHLRDLLQQQKELNTELDSAKNIFGVIEEGTSAHTMERFNIRQDSICLDLRSRIVDVELQISEITGNK